MKRTGFLLAVLLSCFPLFAQYAEVGTYLGASNYIGELSEHKIVMEEFNPMLGIYGKFNATPLLSLKASISKGSVSGNDNHAQSPSLRNRNLNFRSDIIEFALTSEVNFSAYNIRDHKTGVPYFFSGIALTHFNPEAQMRGSWHELQPLRTEGNRYSRTTVAIPLGLGMKFNLTYKLNIGFEIGARKTFTDYLDDVSGTYPDIVGLRNTNPETAVFAYRTPELTGSFGQNPVGLNRGDPGNNDWYFFGGMTLSVNLTDKYGLDFDPEYSLFKDTWKKPNKKLPKKKMTLLERLIKLTKRNQMSQQVKKQMN